MKLKIKKMRKKNKTMTLFFVPDLDLICHCICHNRVEDKIVVS